MKSFTKSIIRFSWKLLVVIILLAFFCVSLIYLNSTFYNFPETKPFSGEKWFNPYEDIGETSYKANFHAHSVAWKSVTAGESTEEEVFEGYSENGYDVVGISNYHKISTYGKDKSQPYIPVYEHGYNLLKSHFLAIDATEVSYFDFPIYQTASHKQKIINTLSENGSMICMAHPKFTSGFSKDDMRFLVNYDFIEVRSHFRNSEDYWDEALSDGKLIWGLANDDSHDIVNEPTYRYWNQIHAEEKTPESLLKAMKDGKSYCITSEESVTDNLLKKLDINDDGFLTVEFTANYDNLYFIGQNSDTLKAMWNSTHGGYNLKEKDTYVRIVAKNRNSLIYLNPVVRYNGEELIMAKDLKVTENYWKTWLFRIIMGLISISILLLIKKIVKTRK